MHVSTKQFLARIFEAAIQAADTAAAIRRHLPPRPRGRAIVIGAGKASAQMASALEEAWDGPIGGVVVTKFGSRMPLKHLDLIEAAHPLPDAAGQRAAQRLMDAVSNLTRDDLVIALMSGGGSALLPAPPSGLSLDDEIAVNQALLRSGAPIAGMNTVRKHVSAIKGGRLALCAYPARVVSLCVSDIPGDDPALIASGPTVPGFGSRKDALDIVSTYRIPLPAAVMAHLVSEQANAPDPSDPRFDGNEVRVIASPSISLKAAAEIVRSEGISAAILSDSIEGEARDVGSVLAAVAREIAVRGQPFGSPVVVLSGGETTVTFKADDRSGRGGRNAEFMLSLASGISGQADICALAADTDGIDGSETNAGAFADGDSIRRMWEAGVNPGAALAAHDSWSAFAAVDDLFVTGPTGTNVNDFRAIMIGGSGKFASDAVRHQGSFT
jgi:hydroxypyruvate reductase